MKVINTLLTDFLKKAGCFEIPCFQRSYSWGEKQWKQLFDDLVSLSRYENVKKHFFGTIVYESADITQISKTNYVSLIDGQQRLVSVSILLMALKNLDSELFDSIDPLLKNETVQENERFKISLDGENSEIYLMLSDGIDEIKSENIILKAYNFFKEQIKESKIEPKLLFEAVKKLEIIDMSLEKYTDNAQLIFDSLNSTGVRLSQVEQIKNFVLLGCDEKEQEFLCKKYWQPMEHAFENIDSKDRFKEFIKDYLTIQNNGAIPQKDCVYEEFNKFYINKLKFQTRETIIKHLKKYSKYYIKMLCSNFLEKDIREHIQAINDLNAKDAYPFLMEVFEDYESELIDKEILLEILSTVKRFVSNRDALSHPQKTFATLSKDINQMLALKNFTPKIIQNSKKMTINDLLEDSEISA